MNFDVAINIDDNFLQHGMAMLCSLCENNKDHKITVHVLQNNLSDSSKICLSNLLSRYDNNIIFYQVDNTILDGVQFRKNRPLSVAAYYRLLLADIIPDSVKKVLYLDVDLIILKDISEIFAIEMDGYSLAATLDQFPYTSLHRLQLHFSANQKSFCSGVMLVNLDYWRSNNVTPHLIEYAKRHREVVYLHDQDVLNYYFKSTWFLLPPKWNRYATSNRAFRFEGYRSFDYKEYTLDPYIIHYAAVGVKPWLKGITPLKEEYVKYLKISSYDNIRFQKTSISKKINMFLHTVKIFVGFHFYKLFGKF